MEKPRLKRSYSAVSAAGIELRVPFIVAIIAIPQPSKLGTKKER